MYFLTRLNGMNHMNSMGSIRKMEVSEESGCCSEWQQRMAESLDDLADEIDTQQKQLDIAKLSFASTGAAAGIVTIVGIGLSPVTFGVSAGLSIAGGVVGGLSAAGNISSLIADKIVSSKVMKRAQEQLKIGAKEAEDIKKQLPELMDMLRGTEKEDLRQKIKEFAICKEVKDILDEKLNKISDKMFKRGNKVIFPTQIFYKTGSIGLFVTDLVMDIITLSVRLSKYTEATTTLTGMATGTALHAANAGRAVGTAADVGVDVAKTAGKTSLSAVKVVGIAAAGAGLAIDLGSIVYYSVKVHKQNPCDIAKKFRRVADCLK